MHADWLRDHELQDANHLLDFTNAALRQPALNSQPSTLKFDGLWLDGFAEMTPQELDLLAAVIPFCKRATLAFCLDESTAQENEDSWLSIWSVVGKSLKQCRQRLANLPGCECTVEVLGRDPVKSRFAKSPALQRLEAGWQSGAGIPPAKSGADETSALRIIACPNSEAEAVFAARDDFKICPRRKPLLRLRRAGPQFGKLPQTGRARVSSLWNSIFSRPPRICRASPAGRTHPQRAAHRRLRLAAGGLVRRAQSRIFAGESRDEIDGLENAALEFGWHGKRWREPLPDEAGERTCEKSFSRHLKIFHAQLGKNKFQPRRRAARRSLARALERPESRTDIGTLDTR